jgi:hypothetical protein
MTVELVISRWVNRDTGEAQLHEPDLTEEQERAEALAEVHEQDPLWSEKEFICEVSGTASSEPDTQWEPGGLDFEVTAFRCECSGVAKFEDLTAEEQRDAKERICESEWDCDDYEPG